MRSQIIEAWKEGEFDTYYYCSAYMGYQNSDVTEAIKKVAEQFKVSPVEGVISHQMKRFVIDGNNCIINKETLEHKVEEFEFEENQAYCIDIVMSTGEGKVIRSKPLPSLIPLPRPEKWKPEPLYTNVLLTKTIC